MEEKKKGERAEQVANWYFRLNGFLSVPGFIVHPNRRRPYPFAEADLMAVRFPFSVERIRRVSLEDDYRLVELAGPTQILSVLVEVKAGLCGINDSWEEEWRENVQRVVRRLGFAKEADVDAIAEKIYRSRRWENESYVFQYVTIGRMSNHDLRRRYPRLVQITWEEIDRFLLRRFGDFPEKLNDGEPIHLQWPGFGRDYGEYFKTFSRRGSVGGAVQRYVETGRLQP